MLSIKVLLGWFIFLVAASPSMGMPTWLECVITPLLACVESDPERERIDEYVVTPEATPEIRIPAITLPDQAFNPVEIYIEDELPVTPSHRLPFVEEPEDEFVLPDVVFEVRITPARGDPTEAGWMSQLAHFAALVLAWFSLNGPGHAGCGNDGDGSGGDGGGDNGGRRHSRDSGSGSSPDPDDSGPSVFDRVGDSVGNLFSALGDGILDVLKCGGKKERGSNDGDDSRIPESIPARIARWRTYATSWRVGDVSRKERTDEDSETLERDVQRLSEGDGVRAAVRRILQGFLERFPATGYTQGFDHACKAMLKAVGNNEASAFDMFTAWASAAGAIFTSDESRQKVAHYAVSTCSRRVKKLLEGDIFMDMAGLNKKERSSTLFVHLFDSPISSMCSRLGLPENVFNVILDETLAAGIAGPGVSAWVTTALLSIAEKEGASVDNELSKGQLCTVAAGKVANFADLEKAANTSLSSFMEGYRKALH